VVASAERDADERDFALDGDGGDQRERAVPAGDAEYVRVRGPRDVDDVLALG
jgi:hypothetical protein